MAHLEATLAKAYRLKGDSVEAERYQARADERGAAIRRLMWSANGFFADYLWREGRQSDVLSAATVVPLFFRIATPDEAHAVAAAPAEDAPRTRRPRHDPDRDRPAMGPAERLGAAAISGDRRAERLRRA